MEIASAVTSATVDATTRASSQLTANFDTFLTLLTTQLRNQDPLDPLDTEKFTEQLVQFAGVEQSIQTNQHLQALLALQSSSANETALSMVGRIATVASDTAALSDDPARWTYALPEGTTGGVAQIYHENGTLVASVPIETRTGTHEISWDGALADGGRAPAGVYRLEITALGQNEQPIAASISTRGLVSAVSFETGAPMIEIAGQRFSLSAVTRVDATL